MSFNKIVIYIEYFLVIVNKKDFIDIFEIDEVEKFCCIEVKGIKF